MSLAATVPKHEAMRNSGAEWLGNIPDDWESKRMKFLFRDHSRKGMPDAELLSVTQNQGVVPRTWVGNRMVMPSGNLESFKFIEEGDFAISLRSFEGGLEYCHHDGIISPAYTVLKQRSDGLIAGYYRYLFKSAAFISELQTSVVGIREGKNISFEELAYSLMPIPSSTEQRAIAAFLDGKCAGLDEAVRIKEAQIALLRERRQILIQQAVTRGLNPAAPMKDSGIDWIGQIPAHWKLKKLKYVSNALRTGRTPPTDSSIDHFDDGTVCWYTPGDFKEDGEFQGAEKLISPKTAKAGFVDIYPENSVYFVGIGGTLGRVNISRVRASCNQQFNVILPSEETASELVLFWLMANRESIYYLTDFSTMPIRNQSQTKNIPIPCPPASEQEQIVEFVQNAIVQIRQIISIKEDQVTALKEYKSSLINAAVTGKVKVV